MAILRFSIKPDDVPRMADAVLLSFGKNSAAKYSAFWVLLGLSGVIATAGVANNSTATVIGAMIVAPLMTPILGTAFALVIVDRNRMIRSLLVVVGGALLVIGIGFLFGLLDPLGAVLQDNPQITSRVNPKLIDLIAALATGTVGAFALVRPDVSDTLPGVAIAISLVPPLAVVGLTLEGGEIQLAGGALLLFVTNVTSIIFTATMVLLLYRVRDTAAGAGLKVGRLRGSTLAMVVLTVLVVAIPLGFATARVAQDSWVKYNASPTVSDWAASAGWQVTDYEVKNLVMTVVALGQPPEVDPEELRRELDKQGYDNVTLALSLVVGGERVIPPTQASS